MGHVDSSQVAPLYANTTPGLTADANVFDPAFAAIIVAINENYDKFEEFKAAITLPIPDQSIVTNHLRNLAVTNAKLAPLSVTADKIADGSITLTKLADLVVTAAKIADGTITEPKYADNSVSRRAIAGSAVGATEIDGTLLGNYSDIAIRAEFDRRGINPDKYNGNDLQKVQSALDEAISQDMSVILTRVFDITGGTININKASDFREPTIIVGVNFGGIKKTDAGFMFTSPNSDVSDFQFENIYFIGNPSENVKVFDCSKLIRLNTNKCYFDSLTTIMHTSDTRYLQSIRMNNDTIIRNVGPALDFAGAYDTVLTSVLMEKSSGSFINHRMLGVNENIYGFRIRDCAIEGLTGSSPAIKFKSCDSLLIDGCYFELNAGGHIVFDATTSNLRHVTISNCRHGGSADVTHFIKWGKTSAGCFSYNNTSQNIGIHDTSQVTSGRIFSIYDKAISGSDNNTGNHIDYIKDFNDSYTAISGVGGYRTLWGSMVRLTSTLTNQTINAGATITYTFDFLEPIYSDDIVSIQIFSSNLKITLNNYYRSGNTIKAVVTNDTASSQTITQMRATVLKAMPTVQG